MAYVVFQNGKEYGARKGLEGPFHYPNGRVLYYDAPAGEYYDPTTDFYVPNDEVAELQQSIFTKLSQQEHDMAGKATSVYLTVSDRNTHKTELHKVFFNMAGLNEFVATEEFKEKYPTTHFYVSKEIY